MKKILCFALCLVGALYVSSGFALTAQAGEDRYALDFVQGGSLLEVKERTVYYADRVMNKYENPYEAPTFSSTKDNGCAVDAGGNALIYYDIKFDDLIPDYSHKYIWGGFTYGTQNEGMNKMFSALYDLMGTDSRGTTVQGFKDGLTKYTSSKGHTMNITSATGTYNNINIDFLKTQLEQEKMAAIFLDGFSITPFSGIQKKDGYDVLTHYVYDGLHVMLVYGYRELLYYDSSQNLIKKDTYLYASTGYIGAMLGWVNIDNFCTIDDIYILEVV